MDDKPTYEELEKRIKEIEIVEYQFKRAEEARKVDEGRFRSVFDNSAVGMAIVSMDGRVVEANGVDCHFLGYSSKEIVGMHFSEFTHSDDLDLDVNLFKELSDGNRTNYMIDKRYVKKKWSSGMGAIGRLLNNR